MFMFSFLKYLFMTNLKSILSMDLVGEDFLQRWYFNWKLNYEQDLYIKIQGKGILLVTLAHTYIQAIFVIYIFITIILKQSQHNYHYLKFIILRPIYFKCKFLFNLFELGFEPKQFILECILCKTVFRRAGKIGQQSTWV